MKLPKILYFIEDCNPTEVDRKKAKAIKNALVVFRNASAVPDEPHALEPCDGVEGFVPEIYAKAYNKSSVAVTEYEESIAEIKSKVGDEAPPVMTVKGQAPPPWTPNKG